MSVRALGLGRSKRNKQQVHKRLGGRVGGREKRLWNSEKWTGGKSLACLGLGVQVGAQVRYVGASERGKVRAGGRTSDWKAPKECACASACLLTDS